MRPFESITSQHLKALISRTIPYKLTLTADDNLKVLRGKTLLNIRPLNPDPVVEVSNKEWNHVTQLVTNKLKELGEDEETILACQGRCCHDLIRLRAAEGQLDEEFGKKIIEWKANTFHSVGEWAKQRRQRDRDTLRKIGDRLDKLEGNHP
jgi:hypothetical protein